MKAVLVCAFVLAYLCYARLLRWKRYHAVHDKFQAKFEAKTLTPEEAQQVMHASAVYDMPTILTYALAFALFKTYAIPSISKLLAETKELGSKHKVSKRYADTEILISTWFSCPISGFSDPPMMGSDAKQEPDPRAMIALARTNYLHSHYNISNDDYLFTLCLFALEPEVWARRFGWRSLSPLEVYAFYTFWVEIGRRMGIRDIPESVDDMKAWSRTYQEMHMVPAETNCAVSQHTLDELLYPVPTRFGIKEFGQRMIICLLEEPVRIAMMLPSSPWYLHTLLNSTMYTISFIQRFFMLPRSKSRSMTNLAFPEMINGVYGPQTPRRFKVKPWYKPQSTTAFGRTVDRILASIGWHSEAPGPHLKCEGYQLAEMGPSRYEHLGHEQVMQNAAELLGCPIPGPWSNRSG